MASSDRDVCTLCRDEGVFKEAVTWCTECEVFLCTDCEKHHKKLRMSKDHKTMSTKDYNKLPTFLQEISGQCRDHEKKFELYCSFHACPCCVQCITDKHKKCQEMKPLSAILKQIKSSATVQLHQQDIKDMKENLEEIIKYLSSASGTINVQRTKAVDKIRSTRKSIDDFLNKIEQEILDDLETKHSQLNSKMNTLLQQLEQRTNQIGQLQNGFFNMTKFATELQMYVGLREIERITSQTATYIEDLKHEETFDEKNLEVTISSSLRSILRDVKSFGDININSSQSTLRIKTGRNEQAQNLVPTCTGIEEIKPSMLRTLTIPDNMKSKHYIFACRILPDGKYLILDHGSNLLLFSNNGMFIRKVVTFTKRAFDTCFVRNNTVAVTLGLANQTTLVDIKKNKITQEIKLCHFCGTVASDDVTMVIGGGSYTITIVNLKDMSKTFLHGVVTDHVALFKANIYCIISKQVCCYTNSGERLWTFIPNDNIIPVALTLDKNGLTYIISHKKNSIVVVSPDGKNSKTILSETDGIKSPSAIDINREMGMLIVSSEMNDQDKSFHTAFVYKI